MNFEGCCPRHRSGFPTVLVRLHGAPPLLEIVTIVDVIMMV